MADNKGMVGGQDRAQQGEDHDQSFRHGISPDEVREMIKRVGNNREALEKEAMRLKRN